MADFFDPQQWYKPERDGSLEDYFSTHNGTSAQPLFKGQEYFEKLKELGVLKPGSGIRIMHDMIGLDEAYIVTHDFKLEGLPGMFAGKEGIHEPETIITKQSGPWEFLP